MYKFKLPVTVTFPRKTKKDKIYYVNLNAYRNWKFIVSALIKKKYQEEIEIPKAFQKLNKIKIKYTFFKNNKRRIDMNNVISIVDKFFSDWLVETGIIDDDDCEHIQETQNVYGGIGAESCVIAEVIKLA